MQRSNKPFAIFAVCVVAALLLVAGINLYQAKTAVPTGQALNYSQFLDAVEHGHVRSVTIAGQKIAGRFTDNSGFHTLAAEDPDLIRELKQRGVVIVAVAVAPPGPSLTVSLITALGTLLLGGAAIYFLMRRSGPGARGSELTLGKSTAKLLTEAHGRVTFEDVAGVDEAQESLQEIVDFLSDPHKFERLGGRIPRGVLLVGPPGTGKTLLARAIAGEANVPFFTISGSHFVEMFVGVGAARVRDLFEQAKKSAPCIIFMDEIDAVGRRRGTGVGNANDEREQTLNQLLVEMDGFAANEGVILIAATNRPDVLDPALLRPGRFDREIVVSKPDLGGRERILQVHVRKTPLEPDVDLTQIARRTPGFSGADLMNLVNEAALLAVRREKPAVGNEEFADARDTVTMGVERRSFVMTEAQKRLTAYREGGRAVVALHAPAAEPVHKVTIIPRGRSSGMVSQTPDEDQSDTTLEQLTTRLAILMAGRAVEEMLFGRGQITSGTGGDIEQATALARSMVTRWGLSEALGAVAYGENQDEVFLGHSVARQQTVSEQTAQAITAEIRKLVDGGLSQAKQILTDHRDQLEAVARGLLELETLSGEDIRDLLKGM